MFKKPRVLQSTGSSKYSLSSGSPRVEKELPWTLALSALFISSTIQRGSFFFSLSSSAHWQLQAAFSLHLQLSTVHGGLLERGRHDGRMKRLGIMSGFPNKIITLWLGSLSYPLISVSYHLYLSLLPFFSHFSFLLVVSHLELDWALLGLGAWPLLYPMKCPAKQTWNHNHVGFIQWILQSDLETNLLGLGFIQSDVREPAKGLSTKRKNKGQQMRWGQCLVLVSSCGIRFGLIEHLQ